MIREQWYRLERETRIALTIAVGFVAIRTIIAAQSGFGFHQGWNEGHYALLGEGFHDHLLVPRYGDLHVYNVPPLFPYLVSASFAIFGESVLAARFPSVLATGGLIIATYSLGRVVYEDRRVAILGAAVLATLPYVQLYGGRVQTDATMVFLVTASIAAIVRGYQKDTGHGRWIVVGGGFFAAAVAAKQPSLLVAGVVLGWLIGEHRFDQDTIRRTGLLIGASTIWLLPLLAWFALNYLAAPSAFVSDWEHELFGRTPPFANVPLLLAVAFGLGMTPPVLLAAAVGVYSDVRSSMDAYTEEISGAPGPSILTWWIVVFGAFVFYRTPHGHQYYAIVLAPPIALLAARGIHIVAASPPVFRQYRPPMLRLGLAALVVTGSLGGTVVLFELSGEFSAANGGGTTVAPDSATFLTEEMDENATLLVPNGYEPPLEWYLRDDVASDQIIAYHVSQLDESRIRSAVETRQGPVYLVYPDPSWGQLPETNAIELFRSRPYEYTLFSHVGNVVRTNSKLRFYLEDRQLVIYRLSST